MGNRFILKTLCSKRAFHTTAKDFIILLEALSVLTKIQKTYRKLSFCLRIIFMLQTPKLIVDEYK